MASCTVPNMSLWLFETLTWRLAERFIVTPCHCVDQGFPTDVKAEENWLHKIALWLPHIHHGMRVYPHVTHTIINSEELEHYKGFILAHDFRGFNLSQESREGLMIAEEKWGWGWGMVRQRKGREGYEGEARNPERGLPHFTMFKSLVQLGVLAHTFLCLTSVLVYGLLIFA